MVAPSIYFYILAVHAPLPTNEAAGPRRRYGGCTGHVGGGAPQPGGGGQPSGFFYLGAANPPAALQEDCSVHMQYTICPQSEETPVRA